MFPAATRSTESIVLIVGPPGAGKTMLARRLPTILPAMTRQEALEVTRLHSVAGLLPGGLVHTRPFRSPHHSISASGLLGGGMGPLRPGEVSLAHGDVFFLGLVGDEKSDARYEDAADLLNSRP